MKVLCVIPAKSHSRRLNADGVGKNFMVFLDKPLYKWVLNEALNSVGIDRIVVTTDSENLMKMSPSIIRYDIIRRPEDLARDETLPEEVILDLLKDSKYSEYDVIVLIQPTSPLITHGDITHALDTFEANNLICMVSVNEQYRPNGAIYIIKRNVLEKEGTFWVRDLAIYKMPNNRSLDIDYASDFLVAEALGKGLIFPPEEK